MIVADYLIKPLHTVATKVPDRNRKWGRLKQAAKLEVFPGLRLASGESGRDISAGNCQDNGVVERIAKI